MLGETYPVYRLLVIGFGVVLAVAVYFLVERGPLGSVIRATVTDRAMVAALGINTGRVLVGVFAAGAALAAVGGVLAGPILGAQPGLDEKVLLLALVVVVIGGLGSVRGALLGAVLIGQVQALGTALLPEYASFLVFAAMALVLLVRPHGSAPGTDGGARMNVKAVKAVEGGASPQHDTTPVREPLGGGGSGIGGRARGRSAEGPWSPSWWWPCWRRPRRCSRPIRCRP